MLKAGLVAAVLLVVGSCGEPTGLGSGGVEARMVEAGMVASNERRSPIYYFAIEASSALSVLWIPCTDPSDCPSIGSGAEETVPYQDIAFWDSTSSRALFYWWHLVADGEGGLRPDSIRAVVAER